MINLFHLENELGPIWDIVKFGHEEWDTIVKGISLVLGMCFFSFGCKILGTIERLKEGNIRLETKNFFSKSWCDYSFIFLFISSIIGIALAIGDYKKTLLGPVDIWNRP